MTNTSAKVPVATAQSAILKYLRENGPSPCSKISEGTGIKIQTIRATVCRLRDLELVDYTMEQVWSPRGRPEFLVSL